MLGLMGVQPVWTLREYHMREALAPLILDSVRHLMVVFIHCMTIRRGCQRVRHRAPSTLTIT